MLQSLQSSLIVRCCERDVHRDQIYLKASLLRTHIIIIDNLNYFNMDKYWSICCDQIREGMKLKRCSHEFCRTCLCQQLKSNWPNTPKCGLCRRELNLSELVQAIALSGLTSILKNGERQITSGNNRECECQNQSEYQNLTAHILYECKNIDIEKMKNKHKRTITEIRQATNKKEIISKMLKDRIGQQELFNLIGELPFKPVDQ